MEHSSRSSAPLESGGNPETSLNSLMPAPTSADDAQVSSKTVPKNGKNGRKAVESISSDKPNSQVKRPRRTTSQYVDYNLKKRRIIPPDDYSKRGKPSSVTASNSEGDSDIFEEDQKSIIDLDENGTPQMNEPKHIIDAKNGATGVFLSQGPSEKIKKEYLWNYKKNSSGSLTNNINNNKNSNSEMIIQPDWNFQDKLLENELYKSKLRTVKSESMTKLSSLREQLRAKDIHENERDKLIDNVNRTEQESNDCNPSSRHSTTHIKIKATISKESKSKLFGQNSIANLPPNSNCTKPNNSRLTNPAEEIENDDFCSSCSQTGSFLCCDTCPRSFHFLCLNPPLNANNLPEGDWSCPQCTFKLKYSSQTQIKKVEKDFIQNKLPTKGKLFGKLIFQLGATNPRQFKLPHAIRDYFVNINTGSRDQYQDEKEKDPLTEKQLFGTPYGQSITKLDAYNPDSHFDPETGELLLCYKCGKSKMGTWDNPNDSRLITRCDYCRTPWHLDCIPEVPRASLKNLGTNWKCPLHAPTDKLMHKQRRMTKNQKFIEPFQTCGFENNGDIDVDLVEISAPGSRQMIESAKNIGNFPPVPILKESSIKLDFMDKIYRAKKVRRDNELKCQEHLIDRLIVSSSLVAMENNHSNLAELISFIYFTLNKDAHAKKLWDFKELCHVAEQELEKVEISSGEIKQLIILKKLLESKPKEELIRFFNLEP